MAICHPGSCRRAFSISDSVSAFGLTLGRGSRTGEAEPVRWKPSFSSASDEQIQIVVPGFIVYLDVDCRSASLAMRLGRAFLSSGILAPANKDWDDFKAVVDRVS